MKKIFAAMLAAILVLLAGCAMADFEELKLPEDFKELRMNVSEWNLPEFPEAFSVVSVTMEEQEIDGETKTVLKVTTDRPATLSLAEYCDEDNVVTAEDTDTVELALIDPADDVDLMVSMYDGRFQQYFTIQNGEVSDSSDCICQTGIEDPDTDTYTVTCGYPADRSWIAVSENCSEDGEAWTIGNYQYDGQGELVTVIYAKMMMSDGKTVSWTQERTGEVSGAQRSTWTSEINVYQETYEDICGYYWEYRDLILGKYPDWNPEDKTEKVWVVYEWEEDREDYYLLPLSEELILRDGDAVTVKTSGTDLNGDAVTIPEMDMSGVELVW